ncbi:trimeric LpxA-like protein [Zychaea mexicana]|uniref:trimeric LpxA-like protein n=1 Tax=Zychaea mexicana TaxID=64656 RepID=UPI0022FDCE13|nr:trimeric LpxA-like protein [Zychaea mexicana]KAI9499023.1 trimeric LpxA-like protein [Zychaea mexicana]
MSRNRITAGPKAVICHETDLRGEISIGTVLHPQCRVIAENGPIYIGKNNIVEENVIIYNNDVEGAHIGNNNIIEARAKVLGTTSIGHNCIIGAACATEVNETISDMTVVYGSKSSRRQQSEVFPTQAALHARHLDYLREVLPKYNHLKKLENA